MEQTAYKHEEIGQLLSLSEAAKYLHVSYATVFRLVQAGELPAFRISKVWRTSDVLCDEYIRKQICNQALICQSTEVE